MQSCSFNPTAPCHVAVQQKYLIHSLLSFTVDGLTGIRCPCWSPPPRPWPCPARSLWGQTAEASSPCSTWSGTTTDRYALWSTTAVQMRKWGRTDGRGLYAPSNHFQNKIVWVKHYGRFPQWSTGYSKAKKALGLFYNQRHWESMASGPVKCKIMLQLSTHVHKCWHIGSVSECFLCAYMLHGNMLVHMLHLDHWPIRKFC